MSVQWVPGTQAGGGDTSLLLALAKLSLGFYLPECGESGISYGAPGISQKYQEVVGGWETRVLTLLMRH